MRPICTVLFIFLLNASLNAQDERILQFKLKTDQDFLNQPVSVSLNGIDYYRDSTYLELYQVEGKKKDPVPLQLEKSIQDMIWFIPGRIIKKGEEVTYEIRRVEGDKKSTGVSTKNDGKNIQVLWNGKEILSYRYALIEAPEGSDPLYSREGGYIHPLKSPSGKVLTCIQPADHYHHYGIWNPWTLTHFEGREVDFWNLARGLGTVRYAGTLSTWNGDLFGGFKVKHEHIDFSAPGQDKTAINEIWDVRAWHVSLDDKPVWIIDFVFTLNCATDSIIRLEAYRYGGGIGFRATPEWTNTSSSVLTSEGKTRKDADGSYARWCMITGQTGQDETSGIIFMSHPANRAHPEPMRVWPEDANNGRGDLFFEFCPIRHKSWILYPGEEYVLKYRLVVFDGTISKETADILWNNYAYPASVTRIENKNETSKDEIKMKPRNIRNP
jgi:hypothetical protein